MTHLIVKRLPTDASFETATHVSIAHARRTITVFPFLIAGIITLLPAAEPTVADSITEFAYHEHSSVRQRATLFRLDGSYQDLLASTFNAGIPRPIALPLKKGTYAFHIDAADNRRGVLTLDPGPNQTQSILEFRDSHSGLWDPDTWYGTQTFHIYRHVSPDSLRNVSNRSWVAPDHTAISGFIVDGPGSRWVLVRCAGPALQTFGVSQIVPEPTVTLYRGGFSYRAINPWGAEETQVEGLITSFALAGAFAFTEGSADCARLLLLQAGSYTIHTRTGGQSGEVLTEVYVLPYVGW